VPLLKRQSDARLAQIARQLKAIEAEMRRLIANDPQTARAFEILCSIPGVSDITAAALIVEMPELGTLDGKSAASLAGLAPMTRQSGTWNGRAFIQGGENICAMHSTCQFLSQPASTQTSRQNTISSKPRQNRPKSPLPQSCESSSYLQMH